MVVGQMRWLLCPSTIRAAYFAGGSATSGAVQLQVQAARSPVASGLNLMVTIQSYHGGLSRATLSRPKARMIHLLGAA